MDPANKKRKKLTDVPEPPIGCSDARLASHFTQLAKKKLDKDDLYEDELQHIYAAALDALIAEKATASRKRRLAKLRLKVEEPVDKRLLLQYPRHFDRRFNEMQQKYKYKVPAYEAVEAEHREIFGEAKYTGYDSYRNSRKKRLKKNKQMEPCSIT